MFKRVLIICFFSLLMDQIVKFIIDCKLQFGEVISVIKGFFYITRTSNTGAAFSILEGRTLLFLVISVIAIIVLINYMKNFKNTVLNSISFGLMIGGILGNFTDRLIFGYVRDFIKLNIFGYNYPIFNIADICIVVGVILFIVSLIRGEGNEKSSR